MDNFLKVTLRFLLTLVVIGILLTMINYSKYALWLYPDNSDRHAELAKIILTIIGGFGVLYSLYLSYKRAKATDDGIRLQGEAINKQSEQLELSRKSQVDERFKNAIEHLGSDKEPIILGGIAELHQIASENPNGYAEVIFNILTSYIRSSANINNKEINKTIIQTIINYLFKSEINYSSYYKSFGNLNSCNFHSLDVNNSNLSNLNLQSCIFPINLEKVNLKNSDLAYTTFQSRYIKECIFTNAKLYNTLFYLAEVENTDFTDSTISSSNFQHCRFTNVNFSNSNFYNNNFLLNSFENIDVSHTTITDSNFAGSIFSEIEFNTSELMSVNDFRACLFKNIALSYYTAQSNFKGCEDLTNHIHFLLLKDVNAKIGKNSSLAMLTEITNSDYILWNDCTFGKLTLEDFSEIEKTYNEIKEKIKSAESIFLK